MYTIPIAFLLAFLGALGLTPLVKRLALEVGAVDLASSSFRKVHAGTIPRLGGLAIVGGFYLPLLGLLITNSGVGSQFTGDYTRAIGLLVGGIPIVLLGLYDDILGASALKKLIVQLAVAIALYQIGFRISAVWTPLGTGVVHLGWAAAPVSVLWIVGVVNAVNLIDGLDGLAAGVVFFAGLTTLVVAIVGEHVIMALLMAAMTGASLGFLVYNFNPASIFMGDTGSMFLGYVIAVSSLRTSTKGAATVALLTPVLALGLPIMDTMLAMARRILSGQSVFRADRKHIHHRLLAAGFTHRRAVIVLYAGSVGFGLLALLATFMRGPWTAVVLALTLVAVVILTRRLGFFRIDSLPELRNLRRQNTSVRHAVRRATQQVRSAAGSEELLDCVVELAVALGASRVLILGLDGEEVRTHGLARPAGVGETLSVELPLPDGSRSAELAWQEAPAVLDDAVRLGLELFLAQLARASARLAARSGPGLT